MHLKAYGWCDAERKLPLETDTVMYGASLTKPVFAFLVMQLVEGGTLALDTPMEPYLKKPWSVNPRWSDLASDARTSRRRQLPGPQSGRQAAHLP